MQLLQFNGAVYFQFQRLGGLPGVWHGIFPRYRFDENFDKVPFNLGLNGAEPDKSVWKNRRRAMTAAGTDFAVFAHQVHGVQVGIWDRPEPLQGKTDGDHVRIEGDALVSNRAGSALFIQTADCQSVLMVDPVRRVVANVHSGWRGSIGNILGRTLDAMVARFGCNPGHIHCGIGPSLGPCCAEFVNYKTEIPEHYWGYRHPGDLFNFWQVSADQLAAKGISRDHIEVSGICTRCNPHLFYSYRGEGAGAGRFAAVVALV